MNTVLLGMFGIQELVIILFILVFIIILPIIVLVDILKSKFNGNDKIIWVLVVIFLGILGVTLYYFIGRKQKIN